MRKRLAAIGLVAPVWLWAAILGGCDRGRDDGRASTVTPSAPTQTSTATSTATPAAMPAPTVRPTEQPATVTPSAAPSATQAERVGAARVIDRGPATRRLVALTFDAGADAGYTSQILDVLRAQGVTASFGITGAWVEQHPELLRRIVGEGHHLINHSYDHDSFTGLSTNRAPQTRAQRWNQLDRTAAAVRAITGTEIGRYFRPPFGDYDATVNVDVYARGYDYNVMWTVDSLGWRGIAAGEIVTRCLVSAQPGAIFIFHVGSQSQDGNAIEAIILGLRQAGYGMGSITELLSG